MNLIHALVCSEAARRLAESPPTPRDESTDTDEREPYVFPTFVEPDLWFDVGPVGPPNRAQRRAAKKAKRK